jgi:poly-gamma-glutamate capsule biosynthesis protein CapA/YwtB (metallophosphatase superfamily)
VKLALAGDTMLGRCVAARLGEAPPQSLFAPELVAAAREADLCLVNLECCISERGRPAPRRVFHFRAPPVAAEALAHLGVDCVTLANNHALDFGPEALLDTLAHLSAAGIRSVGAGPDEQSARAPVLLEAGGERLRVVALSDHPAEYVARHGRPGIAFAELAQGEIPDWLLGAIGGAGRDPVLVSPHWGPNMVAEPVPHVRRAAAALEEAGATLVAGHSAHVCHGVAGRVLFDLGGLLDDYSVDPLLRNDLGLLWLVELEGARPTRLETLPLKLDYCRTRLADGEEAAWILGRVREACAALGTEAREEAGRLLVDL